MVWRPSVDTLFFVLINSILGSSFDLHNHHHMAPSTISNTFEKTKPLQDRPDSQRLSANEEMKLAS